jgi:hypothetical protein
MKKIFIILSIQILFNSAVLAQDYDFRTVKWGMSRVEVLASETLKPLKITDNYISYKFNLFGQDVFLLYEFVLNKLLSAKYVYENPDKENVEKIFYILESKYEKTGGTNDQSVFENSSVFIEANYQDKYLKINYKSKKIEKIALDNKKLIKENEKKYLLSIF